MINLRKGVIDQLDSQILDILKEDSRLSLREISLKLGKSPGTIITRVENLQSQGILKRFAIIIDPAKLGYSLTAVILVQTSGRTDSIKNTLCRIPNIISIYQITGDFDVVLIAKFKGNEEIALFIKQLSNISGVRRVVTDVVLDIIKEEITAKCSSN